MFKTIISSVLTVHAAVYAVQFANYFQVNVRACTALDAGTVLSAINHSGVLKENGQCKEGRIVYAISDRRFSHSPTVTIRHFLSLMMVDMKAHYISELNKLNSTQATSEPQSKTRINAIWKQIETIVPNCKLILSALDYLYVKDVDFEDLLGAYYAMCVVPRKWLQDYWEAFPSVKYSYNDKPYTRLVLFLWDRFGLNDDEQQASLSFFVDSDGRMARWNVFLQSLNVYLSAACWFDKRPSTLWMEPEWLTFSVLMQHKPPTSDPGGMQMLQQSAVQVNDIYKSISNTETTLRDLYRDTVWQDVDPKTLLAWYNVVLEKMDEVMDSFLYGHVAMIYSNMITPVGTADDAVVEKLNGLMKSCNWQFIVQHFVSLLTRLKCSYALSFNRTSVLNAIANESWHNDYRAARKAIRQNPVAKIFMSSGMLKMFPSNVAAAGFDRLILSRGFQYNYDDTDRWIWRNCSQAMDYTRELCNTISKQFGLELDLSALQKFKRNRTL